MSLLYSLSAASEGAAARRCKLVYAAVAAVIGMQLIGGPLRAVQPERARSRRPAVILQDHHGGGRACPGPQCLRPGGARQPLAHPLGDARPRFDLDLRPQPLHDRLSRARRAPGLLEWRGACGRVWPRRCLRFGARNEGAWRVRLSRAATFQSLSLLAICAYFALMAIVATALRGTGLDWSSALMVAVLAVMTVGAMVLLPERAGARLAQGQARQALVRAPLRLSQRMAALHRDARPRRARCAAA